MTFNQTVGLNYSQGYAMDARAIRNCQRQLASKGQLREKVKRTSGEGGETGEIRKEGKSGR